MADVVVQAGHCFRRTGATGTYREQEFTAALGRRLAVLLAEHGHVVTLIGADDRVPTSDVFVALHTDGSNNRARRGASVGYPDAAGARLAAAWKRAHQRHGYPGGFLKDNYTPALRGYYGFRKSRAPVRFLAEHGTTTNRADELWLFEHLEQCALAHVDAINSLFPPPRTPEPPAPNLMEETDMVVAHRPDGLAVLVTGGRIYPLAEGEVDAHRAIGTPVKPVTDAQFAALERLSAFVATGRRL